MDMKKSSFFLVFALLPTATSLAAESKDIEVSDQYIAQQRENLARYTVYRGYGPQSPRDLSILNGNNPINFTNAPASTQMNLCNIHFHKNAEHKGGEFTKYAGNGNGKGFNTGFLYSGNLTEAELAPVDDEICGNEFATPLYPGDTIETHYVYSAAQISPGPTLGSCLSDVVNNPQLRVESQVYVLVNDDKAADFADLAKVGTRNGYYQALNIPNNTGTGIQYAGSSTGPNYNEKGSPFQVTWNVRPKVVKVNIKSVGKWCESNIFNEDHAHGVRNLVINPALLSKM